MFIKGKVVAPVFTLISLFALSSWINASALWVELPLMINILPERWSLPSYVAFVIQCSNIAPVIYSITSKIRSMKSSVSQSTVSELDVVLSFMIIGTSFFASILMAMFWDRTFFVTGQERSIALFCFSAMFSIASCTSSLVYLPYMARFPASYLSVFYFGQGLSGLVPGLIGLAQGLGSDPICINSTVTNMSCKTSECAFAESVHILTVYPEPRFTIQAFFVVIACMLLASLSSFYILNFTRLKNYQVLHKLPISSMVKAESESIVSGNVGKNKNYELERAGPSDIRSSSAESPATSVERSYVEGRSRCQAEKSHLCFYLVAVAILNLSTNGLIPATQSYTCLPYSGIVYTLTVRLSSVIGSLSSLSTLILPIPGIRMTGIFVAIGSGIAFLHIWVALLSPQPPLADSICGPVMIVISALIMTSSFSFARVWISTRLHAFGGRKLLLWCGSVTQLGSFVGATIAFVLINWFKVFHGKSPCPRNDSP